MAERNGCLTPEASQAVKASLASLAAWPDRVVGGGPADQRDRVLQPDSPPPSTTEDVPLPDR